MHTETVDIIFQIDPMHSRVRQVLMLDNSDYRVAEFPLPADKRVLNSQSNGCERRTVKIGLFNLYWKISELCQSTLA